MATQQGALDHYLLYEEFIKTVLGGGAKCRFSNEKESDACTYNPNPLHFGMFEACILRSLNQYFLLFNNTRQSLLLFFNML